MEKILRNKRMFIEVKEIFKYMDLNILNKIPSDIREKFESIDDSEYNFIYDKTKTLKEQNVSEDTKNMISYLYLKYCCDANTRINLLAKIKFNKEEEAKREREKNWLLNRNIEKTEAVEVKTNTNITETALVKKEDTSIFSKIIAKIKSIFGKNN